MINEKVLEKAVFELIKKAETSLPRDVESKLRESYRQENNKLAKIQLNEILKNIKLARENSLPICQDTGMLTFYVSLGERADTTPIEIENAIRKALKKATEKIPLRENLVDSVTRKPRNSNIGFREPEIHFEFVPKKEGIQITVMPKGAGSENVTAFTVLSPNENEDKIKNFAIKKIQEAGARPCPPIILGVGIGGSSEMAMRLAKFALLRSLKKKNKDKNLAKMEERILNEANKLNIGVMGLGGKTTCLKVSIEKADSHTASLPIALSISCWATRRASVEIFKNNKTKFF